MKYIVLIGDIKDSKLIANRSESQEKLAGICNMLNGKKNTDIVSPFTITLGDEFQAVLSSPEHLWQYLLSISVAMHPTKIRYGIGVGEITTKVNQRSAIGMDGPAFYAAREAVEKLKESQRMVRITGLPKDKDIANDILDLISVECESWKKNRLEILLGLFEEKKASTIANAINISEQAVYKNIRDGNLETIKRILLRISGFIQSEKDNKA